MDYENEDLIEMITIGDETDNETGSIVSENFETSPIHKQDQHQEQNCDENCSCWILKENKENKENSFEFLKETVLQLKEQEDKKNNDQINNRQIIKGLVVVTIGSILFYIFYRAIFYDTTRTMLAFLIYAFSAIGLYIYDKNIYPVLDSVYGKDALLHLGKSFEEELFY